MDGFISLGEGSVRWKQVEGGQTGGNAKIWSGQSPLHFVDSSVSSHRTLEIAMKMVGFALCLSLAALAALYLSLTATLDTKSEKTKQIVS